MADMHVDIDPDGDTILVLPPNQTFGSQNNIKNHKRHLFKVTMKQLSIASPLVKAALQSPVGMGILQAEGLHRWRLSPMFDPEAFNIVLSILHAKFSEVPDILSLEMLSNIALIVRELGCEKSVRHFGKLWLTELDKDLDPDEDVEYDVTTCWRNLFISETFGLKDRSEWAGRMVLFWCPNIDTCLKLPINPYFLGK